MKGTLRPGRKAGVLALAVLLLTCVLMAGAVSAAIIPVEVGDDSVKNGNNFSAAVNSAHDGDTISLPAGTYSVDDGTSRIITTKSLTIAGSAMDEVLIKGNKYGLVIQDHTDPESKVVVHLKNLTVETTHESAAGLYVKYNVTVFLESVTIKTPGSTAILLDSANAFSDGKYYEGVTTVVNAKNVIIDKDDKIEFVANPATSTSEDTTTSVRFTFDESCTNIEMGNCVPQGTLNLGMNNLFVNDKAVNPPVAKIGDVYYPTLEAAFNSVQSGETIELLCDTNGNGIIVKENSVFTVDLGGHTYTVDGKTVGSSGTETNCFQLLRDSTLTFKNGKIVSGTNKAKMVIQNYADLTLEDVELVGGPTVQYVLSNNFGNTQLKGDTSITASGNNVAFDVYYWPKGGYGDGVSVTIVDSTVKIQGKVEYARDDTASDDDFSEKASLIIPPGYTLEVPSGYHWASSGTEWKLVADDPADIADTLVLTVNPQTVTAGNTVTLTATLTNSTSGTEFYGVPVTINGVSGVTGLTGAPITYTANTVGTFTLTAQTTDPALTSTSVTLTVNSRPVPPTPVTSSSGNMDNAYRVLFNDGATTLSVVTDLSSGDKLTKPETPVKDGYTFAGWYKDSACTQAWDFETGIPGDMTLYAKWTAAGSSSTGTEATATPTKTATAVTTPQPTKTQSTTATTSAPQATTAAGVSPTLTQAPSPVAGVLFGLLAAGVLLRRRFQ